MNKELAKFDGGKLPANIKDLAKFVLIGRERLVAVRAAIKAIDKVETAAGVREQKKSEAQDLASALLDAEVRLGELFKGMESVGHRKASTDGRQTKYDTIKSLGFTDPEKTAHRFELLADHPEIVERVKAEARENDDLPTRSEVLREIKQEVARADFQTRITTAPPKGKFRTLLIDPPWPVEKIAREVRPNQVIMDYPTMSLDEIASLPIADLAEPSGCHIYLWFTQKYRRVVFDLFDAWGVKDECFLTWVKNVGFTPYSWMYSTEHVLFGRVGNLPLLQLGRRLDFNAKVREHSRKPDEFYELVKQVSPGPRLDFFSREKRDGFEQYGNETEKFAHVSV